MKKNEWTIGDIINFEYFLSQDSVEPDDTVLRKRDRDIYINEIGPELDSKDQTPQNILRLWLGKLKAKEKLKFGSRALFPGDFYEESLSLLRVFFLIAGFTTGTLAAGSFFSYTGRQPLNVSYFFSITVFFQIFILIFFTGFFLLRTRIIFLKKSFLPYPLLGRFVEKLLLKFHRNMAGKIPAEKRSAFYSALGFIKAGKNIYGSLFSWPLFILMQILGIGFNIGILFSTLFTVLVFDTAFGWQSTIQMGACLVHKIVSVVAAPWSWFLPASISFPSIDQIQGSRIVLKDGIFQLATEDLVSWWPFLCLAVLFYGLFPRIVLFIAGSKALSQNLTKQKFEHGQCKRLMNRLLIPIVSTQAVVPEDKKADAEARQEPGKAGEIPVQEYVALVPDDIFDLCNIDEFKRIVQKNLGCYIKTIKRTGLDFDEDMETLEDIMLKRESSDFFDILLLYEAWQPPIKEIQNFIRKIRKSGDKKMDILVALIGRPESDMIFTMTDPDDKKIWNMKMTEIGDPFLHVESLVIK